MIPGSRLGRLLSGAAVGIVLLLVALSVGASAATFPDYRTIDPVALSSHIEDVLALPEAAKPEYWQTKPPLAKPSLGATATTASKRDLEAAERMKRGEFTSYASFPWKPLGVPPPWDTNPFGNRTWDMYRHSLRWSESLLRAYLGKSDEDSLRLMQRVLADWIEKNSVPPGLSRYAWHDHPAGSRLRTICWFWEVWRRSELFDPAFARLLLASVYQHAAYLTDPSVYPADFNHGQEMDAALMVAALTFPEFREAGDWYRLAESRTLSYLSRNFSPEGVHLEQSPFYHWYVLQKGAAVSQYLKSNGRAPAEAMPEALKRAAAVMSYLVKPDGLFPMVGDSAGGPRAKWDQDLARMLGEPVVPAPSSAPNPRSDSAGLFLSFPAGYAVFTSYPVGQGKPASDMYALFKCSALSCEHGHNDALSFILYGLGRDWLVDSGKFNYEENTPKRRYVRSSRAHNVVLVDNADFGFHPVRLVDWGRDNARDFVTVAHEMPKARHTRTFQFFPPATVWITDVLESTDGKPHLYGQLFQVAPGLEPKQAGPGRVVLAAPDGNVCLVDQLAPGGAWSMVSGQEQPYLQGWYSAQYNKLEAIPTLRFTSLEPSSHCVFSTRITLLEKEAAARLGLRAQSDQPSDRPSARPPQPTSPQVVVFSDAIEQYVSRWKQRTKSVTVKREDDGLRCEIVGGTDRTGGQYGGIGFAVPPFKALALDLSFQNPQKIRSVYVDGYDEKGNRVLRWQWQLNAANRPKQRAIYLLEPGKPVGHFRPVGAATPAAVKGVDVFVAIAPGAKTGFVLHRAEVMPAS